MNIERIPILKSLMNYSDEGVIPFHMPGHKKGNIYNKLGFKYFDTSFLNIDVTEIPGIDNLHCPESAILEAQELAAGAFGADYTYFLVNGTTGGIYSMILAATVPGDKIIIPRNSHRAVTGAMILGRLKPIYVNPEVDSNLKIALGIAPSAIERMLLEHPDAKAVVITSPTFYGVCSDVKAIADIVHKYNKVLLVDEAHGAHFRFNKQLPMSAIEAGADIVAQSTHKTLPAMTQSSMLHVKGHRVDIDRLKFFLQLTQTTSPSHTLLASLDIARYIMEEKGEVLLNDTIDGSNWVRDEINRIENLYCIGKDRIGNYGVHNVDATRLTINVDNLGISGCEVEQILRQSFKIQLEMSDLYNIVAISTVGDEKSWYKDLVESISKLASTIKYKKSKSVDYVDKVSIANISVEQVLLPWEAVNKKKEHIRIKDALGRVSGEMVIPYPPGIPILMPGEIITQQVLDYSLACIQNGIKINGTADALLEKITVIK